MEVYDNVLDEYEYKLILDMCINSHYKYGELDEQDKPPTGMTCELDQTSQLSKILIDRISELKPDLKKMTIYRMYINCFAPSENPYFHIDGEYGKTVLYYPNISYDENEGGETQILGPDDLIYGVKPRPNRFLIFDSKLRHRAMSFRTRHRFTIAIKFN
jgi:hypothetical protein